jgi:hypothetical protein
MGMDACITAFGMFTSQISDCLEYGTEHYADIEHGYVVFSSFFHCCTTHESRELAAYLGVDPYHICKHTLEMSEAQLAELETYAFNNDPDLLKEVDQIRRLKAAGFIFVYRPNM